MEFLTERCYTALNADELKLGSKVIVADTIDELKQCVEHDYDTSIITDIMPEYYSNRFNSDNRNYNLAYLVSESNSWIAYLCRGPSNPEDYYLTACRSDKWESVKEDYGVKTKLFEGTDDEVDKWYVSRRHLAAVIAAWEDGKTIQYKSGNGWEDCCDNRPSWDVTIEYRIKPEGLKWTNLNIGDVVHSGEISFMITGLKKGDTTNTHVHFGGEWRSDYELEDWEKEE